MPLLPITFFTLFRAGSIEIIFVIGDFECNVRMYTNAFCAFIVNYFDTFFALSLCEIQNNIYTFEFVQQL